MQDETFIQLPKFLINVPDLRGKCIYEFGVHKGESLITTLNLFAANKIKFFKAYGFDSFKGLPLEKNDDFNHKTWYRGRFDLTKYYGGHPKKAAAAIKSKIVNKAKISPNKLDLFAGWFKNLQVSKEMNLASFVNIDCDQYTSTMQVFKFLFENNLIDTNTIIRFDDWGGTPEFKGGESKALVDSCKKYNYKFKILHKHIMYGAHVKVLAKLEKQ